MIKVLHFYRTYYPDTVGGIEQVIRQLVAACSHYDVHSEVLTLSKSVQHYERIEVEGVQVHRVPSNFELANTGFSGSAIKKLNELAQAVDVVHYHFPYPFMDIAHFAARIKKPSVVTYHSDIVRQKYLLKLYAPLKHCFLNSVDKIIATSPNYLESSTTLGKYQQKTEMITYGLNESIFPQPSDEKLAYWRERFSHPFFLFVGMLRYYKGLHILLEAAQHVQAPILILGNGPVENELRQQATQLRLDHVHFLGALPDEDKMALLQLCYAFVFPSHLRSEAFGISLLESAMMGKPMISCEMGTGTTYVNVNGETGLVIEPNNSVALSQAMQTLLKNEEQARQFGLQARQRFEQFFTADMMGKNYADLYHRLAQH